MKTLIIQLARFGDVFQTYAAINSYRRHHPDETVHLLVRKKFQHATHGLTTVDCVWNFDSYRILAPIFKDPMAYPQSVEEIGGLISDLKKQQYDRVYNLSFSPLSSYLTHSIAGESAQVSGYSRYSDGYLAIPDDTSAYFYSQVGIHKWNRVHLIDIFATMLNVPALPEDLKIDDEREYPTPNEPYFVLHIGSSQKNKSLQDEHWFQFASRLKKNFPYKLLLIGGIEENSLADKISAIDDTRVVNLVGKTKIYELASIIKKAECLIGCDSVAVQIANLTKTRVFNFSFDSVNFWETGPITPSSRVFFSKSVQDFSCEAAFNEFELFINHVASLNIFSIEAVPYNTVRFSHPAENAFAWQLLKALYMEHDFPVCTDDLTIHSMYKLHEVSQLALQQIEILQSSNKPNSGSTQILDSVDDLIIKIDELSPMLSPLIQWFQTERIRIPPSSLQNIISKSHYQFSQLNQILELYIGKEVECKQQP